MVVISKRFFLGGVGNLDHTLLGIEKYVSVEYNLRIMENKMVINRFKDVLDRCIDSDLVPGRLIYDNLLLAYEIFHTFRHKRVGKKGFMVIKLDMSKAYDRVE
ncbi:reverse transcriptase [Gossypium australe]|uniref:Reverse transcriptase n=1 Tax=Gossypium australe TaxID=47621 RepID=A0A5B6VPW4_9ROSI|nr:reverse transcriptase [Gossypium australe]